MIALTDASGNVVRKYAYDPWGARRNASDWTQKDNGSNLIVNRGYTGHEHLDAFGIINMNGRVYDPATGMFLSPDPFIQSPGDWVNYNRYSYCMGNPMRYTDPSGYTWDGVGADGMTNQQWINDYWYQKALQDHCDGAAREMAQFMAQVEQDRKDMATYIAQHMLGGPNPNDVAYHFEGIDAVDVGRSLKDGYGMVIESLKGTDYAVFSKGSFDFEKHADGNMTPSDPSAYFMTVSIWNRSNGGGSSLLGDLNTGLSALGTLNSIGINIAHDYVSYGFKSANGWQEFGKLASNQQAWRATRVLGETGANVLKYAKGLGVGAAVATSVYSAYKAYNYYNDGGTDMRVGIKSFLDVTMTGVGFCGPIGFGISAAYFILDTTTNGFGGFGKIE